MRRGGHAVAQATPPSPVVTRRAAVALSTARRARTVAGRAPADSTAAVAPAVPCGPPAVAVASVGAERGAEAENGSGGQGDSDVDASDASIQLPRGVVAASALRSAMLPPPLPPVSAGAGDDTGDLRATTKRLFATPAGTGLALSRVHAATAGPAIDAVLEEGESADSSAAGGGGASMGVDASMDDYSVASPSLATPLREAAARAACVPPVAVGSGLAMPRGSAGGASERSIASPAQAPAAQSVCGSGGSAGAGSISDAPWSAASIGTPAMVHAARGALRANTPISNRIAAPELADAYTFGGVPVRARRARA